MNDWRRSFVEKLSRVQNQWVRHFEEAMSAAVEPAFEQLAPFLRENGFKVSTPLREEGRRSYKFELAENVYLLVIFRFAGVGELELRSECFVPGGEPALSKSVARLVEVDQDWSRRQFESSLDAFVDLLAGSKFAPGEAVALL
jgi:hypothetical protein